TAADLPNLCGLLVFGTPPLQDPPRFDLAFHSHPSTKFIFQEQLSDVEISLWAQAQGLSLDVAQRVIQAMHLTDPKCRSSLAKSISRGELRDECAILRRLAYPVAILHGEQDPFVNRDYMNGLHLPGIWRDCVTILPNVGHSPQLADPKKFDAILLDFVSYCLKNAACH
ncbi:MAG: alpha/beta hydrolase, partial [Magnetococcales bacterium]|nr:alpha/beta hydrolase [Magnetococcales bacterium]